MAAAAAEHLLAPLLRAQHEMHTDSLKITVTQRARLTITYAVLLYSWMATRSESTARGGASTRKTGRRLGVGRMMCLVGFPRSTRYVPLYATALSFDTPLYVHSHAHL